MSKWTQDELDKMGTAEELQIAPLQADGTPQKPVIIWVVRVDDALYVRSVRGSKGAWFRAAQARHEGRIQAGGLDRAAEYVGETDPRLNDRIDVAYHTKYAQYPQYVAPMVTEEVRATTLKLLPLEIESGT